MNANLNSKCESGPSGYEHSAVMSPTTNIVSDATTVDSQAQLKHRLGQVTNSSEQHLLEVGQDMYNGNSDSPSGSDSSSSSASGSDRESSPVAQDCAEQPASHAGGGAGILQMQGERDCEHPTS